MSSVVLTRLAKRFGAHTALKSVDLEVHNREFLAIVGPSGCGKSSMLRLISGLERPSAGRILFDDKDVTALPAEKRDVAMVFQSYALYPHMSVRRNLTFPLQNMKVAQQEIDRRLARVAKSLDIEALLERRPRELSGGQRQRVALGRAVIRDAAIFLFDEPLSNLDAKLRVSMRSELKQLHDDLGKTFIYVTHDQSEAMTMADRIVVMSNGEVQQIGTAEQIYFAPRNLFVAEFIGTPTMNLLTGRLEAAGSGAVFVTTDGTPIRLVPNRAAPGPATAGIRPEAVSVTTAGAGDFDGVVELVEPLHPDIFLTIGVAGARVVAKVGPETPRRKGERVGLRFEPAALHLFGPDGARLPGFEQRSPVKTEPAAERLAVQS